MERGAWTADDDPLVGLVREAASGDDGARVDLAELESTATEAGASSVAGALEDVLTADPDVLVTIGEGALAAAARTGATPAVLPVGSSRGIGAVAPENAPAALSALLSTGATECRRPLLALETTDGRRERALFDVTIVTDEPATISEYSVRTPDERIAQFRADGVVIATPAGTHGYAGDAGGPRLSPDVDALAVVPVAPFVMRTSRWILSNDRLAVTVERDESDVTVYADGRATAGLEDGATVTVGVSGTVSTLLAAGNTPVRS